jgi:CTP:molybdopterin cytidylyltransferase MocA
MTYVVLAAGASRRMGFDKVFTPLGGGESPLQRIAALLEGRVAIVVVPSRHLADAATMAPALRAVENDEPARGMAHSLRRALTAIGEHEDFGVLLGDKPFFGATLLDRMERAFEGFDVAYPVSALGVPGHPVLFSARVRALAESLPDGDTLALLRDDPSLRRNAVLVKDAGAFADLNDPEQWAAANDA